MFIICTEDLSTRLHKSFCVDAEKIRHVPEISYCLAGTPYQLL